MPSPAVSRMLLAGAILCVPLAESSFAGDARHAAQSLDALERFLADGTPDGLSHAEDLAGNLDADLDGLEAATRDPLLKRLHIDRKKIAAGRFAHEKAIYVSRVGSLMDAVRNIVAPGQENVRVGFASTREDLERVEKELAGPDAATFLDPPTREKFSDELTALRAKVAEKFLKENIEYVQSRVESAEGGLPEFLEKAKQAETNKAPEQLDSPARSMQVSINDAAGRLTAMPPNNPAVKKLIARVNAARDTFETAVVRVQGADAFNHLTEDWATLARQTEGWESEPASLTLAAFTGPAGAQAAALGAPKTVDLVRVSNSWLKKNFGAAYGEPGSRNEDNYRVFLRDPKTRALVEEVIKDRDAAEIRLIKTVTGLLDEADKPGLPPEARERFATLNDRTLPESLRDSPAFRPVVARLKALAGG